MPRAAGFRVGQGAWEQLLLVALTAALFGCTRGSLPHEGQPSTEDAGADRVGAACENPGRTVVQRLNRAEYRNTVRDLLGVTADPTDGFPEDDRANVFDNNAALQSMSSLRLQAYLEAAEGLASQVLQQKPSQVVSCWPASAAEGPLCARQILAALLPKAYRRPATSDEIEAVLGVYAANAASSENSDAGFAAGLAAALEAVLVSPQFLFRQLGPGMGEPARPLDDHELATRLSYFLWRSMPDDGLRALAEAGQLHQEPVLRAEVNRLLVDPRASELIEVLAEQWLALRGLAATAPDRSRYADYYDQDLAASMEGETKRFLASLLKEGAPLGALVIAPYSFVDAKLAALYGVAMAAPASPDYVRVDLSSTARRGLLGQASVLALNANADRTSIVKRGKWILSVLLCTPLPDPPANVVQQFPKGDKPVGQRALLAEHRKARECKSCHGLLDPPGLALDGFDLLGRSRTQDEDGLPIDTQGTFDDGRAFSGPVDLGRIVRDDPRFAACVTRNLMTYGLARELNEGDLCLARAVAESAPAAVQSLTDVIAQIVTSPAFLGQPGELPQ